MVGATMSSWGVPRAPPTDMTLAGESIGATVSLTASTELEGRVRRVVAFNPYDYPGGVGRANGVASVYVNASRLAAVARLSR